MSKTKEVLDEEQLKNFDDYQPEVERVAYSNFPEGYNFPKSND